MNLRTWRGRSAVVGLGIMIMAVLAGPASADPGTPQQTLEPGKIVVTKQTTLRPARPTKGGPQPLTVTTDLGGGLQGFSDAGMQWRQSLFFGMYEDVQGLTQSYTNATIDEVEAHGALIKAYNSSNCYFGDNLWTPAIRTYNSTFAGSGWGPFFTGSHNCWAMATGHEFVVGANRYQVSEPNITHQF